MAEQQLIHQAGERLFVTSLDISSRFGKQHKNVIQAIETLECSPEFSRLNFQPSDYTTERGKTYPLYEITRDGFTFLCMGFTGPQAALWKERYIAAFNAMEQALRQADAAPLPAVTHSPRLEASMQRMAQSVETLANGMNAVLTQLDVTRKYIGLLELNQAGTRKVTAEVAREAHLLKAEGMNNADIARLLRISRTAVSLIVRDKYPAAIPPASEAPKAVGAILEGWIEREQQRLADALPALKGGA